MSDLSDHPQAEADRRGLLLVLPEPNQIFIDLDNPADRETLDEAIVCLKQNGEEVIVEKETRSVGGNAHVYIKLPRWTALDPMIRIALQACLGSDRKRELLAILRVVRGYDIPASCFFEVPTTHDEPPTEDTGESK